MSDKYNAIVTVLTENQELRQRVMAADTVEGRAAILREAGLETPTQEEIDQIKLAGVAGGMASITQNGGTHYDTASISTTSATSAANAG